MTDLTYTDDGMFTRFIPQTPAGEAVWRTMHDAGHEVLLSIHARAVIAQIKAAGYTVRKARKVEDTREALDALYRELMA